MLENLLIVLAVVLAVFLIFCVLWFLFAMIRIWVLMNETRGMNAKEVEKWEQENCSHENSIYTESHPDKVWTCSDCGKSV